MLDVTLQEKPQAIIDLATLTGACVVALGSDISGLMTNNADLTAKIETAAAAVGELVWELPMHAHFKEQIQSQVADIKNIGDGRWGGAITAAKFLEEFVADKPWTTSTSLAQHLPTNPRTTSMRVLGLYGPHTHQTH